jgi:hypothetical protein
MSEPITNVEDAVPELGALPVPVGPERPESVTPAWLMEIAARAEAATPGPWCTDAWEIYQGDEYLPGISAWIGETCRGTSTPEQDRADAEFVAHARTDVPALLARVAELEAHVEALLEERHRTNEWADDAAKALRRQRDRITELEAQRAALTERLRAGQHWQRGRNPELVSENYVSQSELREIFSIPLVAPWDEDPCRPCGCPKRFDRHADGCPTLPAEAGEGQ